MSELLDIYDEKENFIGQEDRNIVHEKGLWHKTAHCWIVKKPNWIIFQQRSKKLDNNPGKLYTTASGHLSAGESTKEALKREVLEECGTTLNTDDAKLIDKLHYKADFIKENGKEFHDRAIVEVYLLESNKDLTEFNFQDEELDGLYALPIKETLDLFNNKINSVTSKAIIKENGKIKLIKKEITLNDFLVVSPETTYKKYGKILKQAALHFNLTKKD